MPQARSSGVHSSSTGRTGDGAGRLTRYDGRHLRYRSLCLGSAGIGMQPPYWWAAVAAIAWPLAQLLLFVGRFGRWPEGSPLAGLAASLVFAPLGALSG